VLNSSKIIFLFYLFEPSFFLEKNEAKLANAVCEAKTSLKKIGAKMRF